jgi:SAM-dependent methyltransferase
MRFDPVKAAIFDSVLSSYLEEHPDLPERWVLEQDTFTAVARRALLGVIAIEDGWTVLDAGCGFGVVPLDLIGNLAVEAHGLDHDPAKLEVARELQGLLASQRHPVDGAQASFETGTLDATPYDDSTFDFVLASFVYQHLADPEASTDEMYRIVKPGGLLCLVDADDGLSLVYPEPSDAFSKLSAAFNAYQERQGGDRFVGRKLASFLDGSGFEVVSTLVLPAAEYRASPPDDPARRFVLERFAEARDEIVSAGILSAEEFDDAMKAYESETSLVQYRTNAQLIAVGRRPVR